MTQLKVVHYLNQFFAGIGGEDKANTPPGTESRPLGPGNSLHQTLTASGDGAVVATVFCGDTYFTEHQEESLDLIVDMVRDSGADVLVAGPAFGSGRYGLACAQVCQKVASSIGIPVLAGMHPASPGAEQYKGEVYMASTAETAVGMPAAISAMTKLALKLGRGEELGPADEDGYIPTGRVKTQVHEKTMAQRLVDMALKKVRGEPFETEWPLPTMEKDSPSARHRVPGRSPYRPRHRGRCRPQGQPRQDSQRLGPALGPLRHRRDFRPHRREMAVGPRRLRHDQTKR